jgi:hypothetical protein
LDGVARELCDLTLIVGNLLLKSCLGIQNLRVLPLEFVSGLRNGIPFGDVGSNLRLKTFFLYELQGS